MPAKLSKCVIALVVVGFCAAGVHGEDNWQAAGKYTFDRWEGPPLTVHYSIPPGSNSDTPILVVIPGAKRNARQYRDEWDHLAVANHFITLVIGARKASFPSEYEYNLGGVAVDGHSPLPRNHRLIAAIDPLFEDFKQRFGSSRSSYSLYGHSAGGGFVHLFMLVAPDAKIDRAVAANAAFYTMPDDSVDFPFGLQGFALAESALARWFAAPLVVLVGERDLDPRTQPLSNSAEAQRQGPHDFARGLAFYREAMLRAKSDKLPFRWRVQVVPNVGHSNAHMASHAVPYLFDN